MRTGRNTAEQNKVVDSEKKLKATVWKENTEMKIPSPGQQVIRLGGGYLSMPRPGVFSNSFRLKVVKRGGRNVWSAVLHAFIISSQDYLLNVLTFKEWSQHWLHTKQTRHS